MSSRLSVRIEAPVEKVFDFFKDPLNWLSREQPAVTRPGYGMDMRGD